MMTEQNRADLSRQPDYLLKIDELKDNMIEDLRGLLKIKSVKAPAVEGAPFGQGVKEAFHYMLDLGKREGFACTNIDEYGGHMDFAAADDSVDPVDAPETMGILCHLDVVPEGNDWEHDPYGADMEDGVIFGRGTLDDKGPTIAAFYAIKAIKDCGYTPKKNIRIILGLDEETGSEGMEYYKEKVAMPDFAIVPDADFPLVHGEMGILMFDLVKKFGKARKGGLVLKSVKGGNAPNMVPDKAQAVISGDRENYAGVKAMAAAFTLETGYDLTVKGRGASLEITVVGKSAHGAHPWSGLNAVSILMEFLGRLDFNSEEQNDFVSFYNQHIGYNLHGENIGCGLSDEVSGKLIWNSGIIDLDQNAVKLTVNVRAPITLDDQDVYDAMSPVLEKYDIGVVKNMYHEPIYFPAEDPTVQLLLSIYRKHSGDTETEPLVIGGGTYARQMANAIAFGALYPGDPDLMHQKNECITIESLVQTTKIYAETIYRLAVEPEVRV
ncbi:MAG: dipeptidase PepV [Firmicutes bacterium]|nr:dipeptidase PepV [Bacillota bacterium]